MNRRIKNLLMIMLLIVGTFFAVDFRRNAFSEEGQQMVGYEPSLKAGEKGITRYNARFFGGYGFDFGSKWRNMTNFNLEDRLNLITFTLVDDSKQSLNITISETAPEDMKKPIDLKNRLQGSLEHKGIKFVSLTNRDFKINGHDAEIADASLESNKNISMIAMKYGHLSVLGTMGYFPEPKKLTQEDLVEVFSTFHTQSVPLPSKPCGRFFSFNKKPNA